MYVGQLLTTTVTEIHFCLHLTNKEHCKITHAPPLLLKIALLFSYANHLKNGPIILKLC